MKPRSPLPVAIPLAVAALLLTAAFASRAAQTHPHAPAGPSPAPTNALPEIPLSVFTIPTCPQEGKDPFFPRSTRLYNNIVVSTNPQSATAPVVAVELHLNGISGMANRQLAIINNRTFATGEEGEVIANSGRVHITCEAITTDSVRVLVHGEERILRLRAGL